jgi:hypothetical protein
MIKVAYAVENLPVASGAFVGVRFGAGRSKPWTMDELLQKGFDMVEWDGKYVFSFITLFLKVTPNLRTPIGLLDEETRIFVALAGCPDGNDYDACAKRATAAMVAAAHEGSGTWTKKQTTANARGNFPAFTGGIGMGGGRTVKSFVVLRCHYY